MNGLYNEFRPFILRQTASTICFYNQEKNCKQTPYIFDELIGWLIDWLVGAGATTIWWFKKAGRWRTVRESICSPFAMSTATWSTSHITGNLWKNVEASVSWSSWLWPRACANFSEAFFLISLITISLIYAYSFSASICINFV